MKDDTIEKINKTLLWMQVHDEIFIGNILKRFKKIFSKTEVETAGIGLNSYGGFNLYLNPNFFKNMTTRNISKILKHEALHFIGKHFIRLESATGISLQSKEFNKDDKEKLTLWNIACDVAINQSIPDIEELGGYTPTILEKELEIKRFSLERGETAEYYYKKIMDERKKGNSNVDNLLGSGTLDDHKFWEECVKNLSQEELEDLEREINNITKNSLKDAQNKGYKTPKQMEALIQDIDFGKINWKLLLKKFLRDMVSNNKVKTVLRRNRRHSPPSPYKGSKKETEPQKLVIAVDTSGSIRPEQLQLFYNEIHSISLLFDEIWIIEADTEIRRVFKFDPKNIGEIEGRGGTLYSPVYEYILEESNPDIGKGVKGLIYFGDNGHFDNDRLKNLYNENKEKLDILFVINGGYGEAPDYGKVIIME